MNQSSLRVEPNLNTFSPATAEGGKPFSLLSLSARSKVVVIGAGAFGGWSALYLARKGFKVTLIDAWGPANSRSSSGDETRVIRSTYGANELYFDLNVRAIQLWKENQERFQKILFCNTEVLWFCYDEKTPVVDDSIPFARKHKMEYEYLSLSQIVKRYPIVNTADLHHAYLDPFGGYLKARESCLAVLEAFVKEGGNYIQAHVTPGVIQSGKLESIFLSDGKTMKADVFLFACGSWLNKMFPEVLHDFITCTKQEVYYFGVPPRESVLYENFPAWVDVDGKDFYYGIAGNTHRGFKIGVDKRGEIFDPSKSDHTFNPSVLKQARDFLTYRFPGLKNAPLLESRVCPYESSPTGNFIFDHHPEADNIIFLGGGSGHGFKHGPALGELIADVLAGERKVPELFRLNNSTLKK